MKPKLLLTFCAVVMVVQLFAQYYPYKGVDFTAPKGYNFKPMLWVDMGDIKEKTGMPLVAMQVFDTILMYESNDKNCMIFYGHAYGNDKRTTGDLQYLIDEMQNKLIYSVYDTVRSIVGRYNISEYVTHVSHSESKKRFNADSLIILDVPIKKRTKTKL